MLRYRGVEHKVLFTLLFYLAQYLQMFFYNKACIKKFVSK